MTGLIKKKKKLSCTRNARRRQQSERLGKRFSFVSPLNSMVMSSCVHMPTHATHSHSVDISLRFA